MRAHESVGRPGQPFPDAYDDCAELSGIPLDIAEAKISGQENGSPGECLLVDPIIRRAAKSDANGVNRFVTRVDQLCGEGYRQRLINQKPSHLVRGVNIFKSDDLSRVSDRCEHLVTG